MYRIVPSTLSHGYKHSIIFKNRAAYLSFHVIFKFEFELVFKEILEIKIIDFPHL